MLSPALLSLSALTVARAVACAVLLRTAGAAVAEVLDGHSWRKLSTQSCALAELTALSA